MSNEIKPQLKPIDWLKPYALNAKIHTPDQINKIAESIKRFKWNTAIVAEADGTIIAGHGRRLAAIQLGHTHVPVIVRDDLSQEEARALRLADNRVALSDIDARILQEEMASLDLGDLLEGIFDAKELDFMTADLSGVNDTPFVEDLDAEVREQAAETTKKLEATDAREVKLDKALGFKAITGRDEKHVARFMALIEEQTGLTGADAFVAHAKAVVSA